MKTRFTDHGYFRTILLSILAACLIECIVNYDEVRTAFTNGRHTGREKIDSVRATAASWLQLPQQVSRLAGKVYSMIE